MKVKDIVTIDKMRSKVLVDEGFAFPLYKKELKLFNIAIGKELYNYETDIEIHLKKSFWEKKQFQSLFQNGKGVKKHSFKKKKKG